MASIIPTFDLTFNGNGTVTSEVWVKVNPTAIPTGSQFWIGYATFISNDKSLVFELRPNLPGKSAGNLADTQLRGFASVTVGESKDIDFFYYGNILTLAPTTTASTGVENIWLRIRAVNNNAATFDYMIFYTIY